MTLKAPITPRLEHPDMERVRRNHEERIKELQTLPSAGLRVIPNVILVDSTETVVNHGLGRRPLGMFVSPPRGSTSIGRIIDIRRASYDTAKVIVLEALGWGATITVDVLVL